VILAARVPYDQMRTARDHGATHVDVVVSWRDHDAKKLAQYVERAKALDLGVVFRPGPFASTELPYWGLPDHVLLGKSPWIATVPRAWPIPDRATLRPQVEQWFAQVAEIATPDYVAFDTLPAFRDGVDMSPFDDVGFAGIPRIYPALIRLVDHPFLPPAKDDPETLAREAIARGAKALTFVGTAPWIAKLAMLPSPEVHVALVDTRDGESILPGITRPIASFLGVDLHADAAWRRAIARALELANLPYDVVPPSASEAQLAKYRAIIVPIVETIDPALWQRLHALAAAKTTTIVLGPHVPADPPKRIGRIRPGSNDDLPGLAEDFAGLV
jgi:hypothetical protein